MMRTFFTPLLVRGFKPGLPTTSKLIILIQSFLKFICGAATAQD